MTIFHRFEPSDWSGIRLIAFDVDGTLYRQKALRLAMARDMLAHALWTRDINVVRILTHYRRIRERLSDDQVENFERVLFSKTADATANTPDFVATIVAEWMERRPLAHLPRCVYPILPQLFDGMRRQGKSIGILSDYPALAKLEAMRLKADHVVTALDVGVLKPHPRGLQALIALAGASPRETVLIGDRADRDGLAARATGAVALIRSEKPLDGWQTFARYDDALFASFLGR